MGRRQLRLCLFLFPFQSESPTVCLNELIRLCPPQRRFTPPCFLRCRTVSILSQCRDIPHPEFRIHLWHYFERIVTKLSFRKEILKEASLTFFLNEYRYLLVYNVLRLRYTYKSCIFLTDFKKQQEVINSIVCYFIVIRLRLCLHFMLINSVFELTSN